MEGKYEQKDNEGALFRKDKDNEKQPDVRGPATVEGKEYEVAGWYNTAQSGLKYLKLKFELKDKNESQPQESGEGEDDPWL